MSRIEIMKSIVSNIQNGIFVEIGTHTGGFAEQILSANTTATLYCIDPYISYTEYNDAINNITGDNLFNNTQNRLKNMFADRIIFIRHFSSDAISLIPNNIDFLYIDGNHQYKYVYDDLQLYFPKVKHGCYIMGDDASDTAEDKRNNEGDIYIEWCPGCYGHYGVIKAFRDFININIDSIKGHIVIGNQYLLLK